MKKLILTALTAALAFNVYSQRVCGTLQHEEFLNQQNPKRAEQRKAYEKNLQTYIHTDQNTKSQQSIIQIPLVVHMVYSSATDSITDAQIFSQIQILNDDYTRQNADAVNTPAAFQGAASAPMVQYCWAQQDPNGNPTNGIERRKSSTTTWGTDDKVKSFATGGLNAWDPSRYFNIWVCNLGGGLLGYGEFPSGAVSNTYGFVAGYFCFGNIGKVNPPYDKGRTATHEIGHCFNLAHIWGDEPACSGDDLCADTPNQAGENYGCPTYPHTDACQASAPGVMYMNYMDYTDDACMNMFTADQSARMVAVVNFPPYNSLKNSSTCYPAQANDAAVLTIIKPSGNACVITVTPQVIIKNWGTTALTSATVNYKIDNGSLQTASWSGNLAHAVSATVTLAPSTVAIGTHTITVYTTLPNGAADGFTANDTASQTFNIISSGGALPLMESFENATYPPNGWTLYNPDAATTWSRTNVAAKTGTHSVFMDNYNYNAQGQPDGLVTPPVDLTTTANPVLTFQVAYQLYTDPTLAQNYSDTLEVLLSSDCEMTYGSIYKKFSTVLTTTTPPFNANQFTPSTSEWRQEMISLSNFKTLPLVFVKFQNINSWENQMYLDDINIVDSVAVGVQLRSAQAGVLIYPNPSADGKFLVDIKKDQHDVNKLNVFDMLGNKVYGIDQKIPAGFYDMNLSNLPNGTYFVEIIKDNKPLYTKIVINK